RVDRELADDLVRHERAIARVDPPRESDGLAAREPERREGDPELDARGDVAGVPEVTALEQTRPVVAEPGGDRVDPDVIAVERPFRPGVEDPVDRGLRAGETRAHHHQGGGGDRVRKLHVVLPRLRPAAACAAVVIVSCAQKKAHRWYSTRG